MFNTSYSVFLLSEVFQHNKSWYQQEVVKNLAPTGPTLGPSVFTGKFFFSQAKITEQVL